MGKRNKKKYFNNILILDTATKGKTVAKTSIGEIIFLSSGVPGDIVDIETYNKKKGFFEGNIIKFNELSKYRVKPKCEHFGVCGGCKWQHMSYESQLQFKSKEVKENIKRIAGIKIDNEIPIMPARDPYYYRNKLEFSFSNQRWLTTEEINSNKEIDKNALGFHKAGMWDKVVDINKCHLQIEPSNEIRNSIKNYADKNKLDFFDPKNKNGLLRNLMIRSTIDGQIMVLIQFYQENKTEILALLNYIVDQFPKINSLLYVINRKANDTIFDQEIKLFYGKDHITEKMEGLFFKITAKSFYQTNPEQAFQLYKIVRNFADLKGDELIYDLYTGTGTIAQFISKNALKVIGVDVVPESILAARENAVFNKIKNVEFEVGDIKNVFNETFINNHGKPSIIITDPPREGMHLLVLKQIIEIKPEKIIYISCNSSTQARDISLIKHLYEISKINAVDMFPQTHHVENVVLLKKIVK